MRRALSGRSCGPPRRAGRGGRASVGGVARDPKESGHVFEPRRPATMTPGENDRRTSLHPRSDPTPTLLSCKSRASDTRAPAERDARGRDVHKRVVHDRVARRERREVPGARKGGRGRRSRRLFPSRRRRCRERGSRWAPRVCCVTASWTTIATRDAGGGIVGDGHRAGSGEGETKRVTASPPRAAKK